jgi:hypothetical protein
MCRIAVPLPIWDASAAKFRRADFDRQNVALLTPGAGLIYGLAGLILGISAVRIYETSGVALSELSKLLNQENALSVPCLKHFRNYCGPIKLATCGFPWEKTTKTPAASRISGRAALAGNNDVRLSSRKAGADHLSSETVECPSGEPPRHAGAGGVTGVPELGRGRRSRMRLLKCRRELLLGLVER